MSNTDKEKLEAISKIVEKCISNPTEQSTLWAYMVDIRAIIKGE